MKQALRLIDEAISNLRGINSISVASEISLLEATRSQLVSKLFGYSEPIDSPPCAVPGYIKLTTSYTPRY